MSNFYIELKDGKTVNHPIAEENLKYFFPDLDPNSPPEGFARFVRKPMGDIPMNMRLDYTEYVLDEELTKQNKCSTYTDKYVFRPYTIEERNQLIDEFKRIEPEKSDWIFDESTNSLIPPVPKPNDGKNYVWISANTIDGIAESKWMELEQVQLDDPDFLQIVQTMKELQQELGLDKESLYLATENITSSFTGN